MRAITPCCYAGPKAAERLLIVSTIPRRSLVTVAVIDASQPLQAHQEPVTQRGDLLLRTQHSILIGSVADIECAGSHVPNPIYPLLIRLQDTDWQRDMPLFASGLGSCISPG